MNGPQHYCEAERLLTVAGLDLDYAPVGLAVVIGRAQAHATLALVAATYDAHPGAVSPWGGDE